MAKVIAKTALVGSYPAGAGQAHDFTQRETRVKNGGELAIVEVAYISVKATVSVELAATPMDIENDKARVANGGQSWLTQDGRHQFITHPGEVTIGGNKLLGDAPGVNPIFNIPDDVAKQWAERGLVEIVSNEKSPSIPKRNLPNGASQQPGA